MNHKITFYLDERHEISILEPLRKELAERGHFGQIVSDFTKQSAIGIYSCHPNRFFDWGEGIWNELPSKISVVIAHDFDQAKDSGPAYFIQDGWHRFDLGLVPGIQMITEASRAEHLGYQLPKHGLRQIGWIPSDSVLKMSQSERLSRRNAVRDLFGFQGRTVLLLASSWSNSNHINELANSVLTDDFGIIARYPAFSADIPASPWQARLAQARKDVESSKESAAKFPHVVVPEPTFDLYSLLLASDVVVSNGSTVLKEGLILERPGVSVNSWLHPSGPSGMDVTEPSVNFPGILDCSFDQFNVTLAAALSDHFRPYVVTGQANLVPKATLGKSAQTAADQIESLLSMLSA